MALGVHKCQNTQRHEGKPNICSCMYEPKLCALQCLLQMYVLEGEESDSSSTVPSESEGKVLGKVL